jgi:hypothetical protein
MSKKLIFLKKEAEKGDAKMPLVPCILALIIRRE